MDGRERADGPSWGRGVAVIVALELALGCGAARAQEKAIPAEPSAFCPERPGLGTPTCTVGKGRVGLEVGIGDWTRDKNASEKTDAVAIGDWLARFGLTDTLEAQVGWTSYARVRTRDRASGAVSRDSGGGDVGLALRQNLRNPDGSGLSIAVMPSLSLPTGSAQIGNGDWGAGVSLPMSLELTSKLSLGVTPAVEAAGDGDGKGRHPAYGSVVGLGLSITDSVSSSLELSVFRDRDPDGRSTTALTGLSVAWQPADNIQIDAGVNLGLNRTSPDSQFYLGASHRF